jgi:hypothetical protein
MFKARPHGRAFFMPAWCHKHVLGRSVLLSHSQSRLI